MEKQRNACSKWRLFSVSLGVYIAFLAIPGVVFFIQPLLWYKIPSDWLGALIIIILSASGIIVLYERYVGDSMSSLEFAKIFALRTAETFFVLLLIQIMVLVCSYSVLLDYNAWMLYTGSLTVIMSLWLTLAFATPIASMSIEAENTY